MQPWTAGPLATDQVSPTAPAVSSTIVTTASFAWSGGYSFSEEGPPEHPISASAAAATDTAEPVILSACRRRAVVMSALILTPRH
ncbi:hypothetical protein [Curtobacterium sp. NPDC088465]|uniref:hypothetical protein n=1 Tax=Curtobacterium sp. NPDC088465 TaxID=3363967 RepID=UPI0038000660